MNLNKYSDPSFNTLLKNKLLRKSENFHFATIDRSRENKKKKKKWWCVYNAADHG